MSQPARPKKTHLAAACPCCGAEVTRPQRYWFALVRSVGLPWPRVTRFHVCAACADIMLGDDAGAKSEVIANFVRFADALMAEDEAA